MSTCACVCAYGCRPARRGPPHVCASRVSHMRCTVRFPPRCPRPPPQVGLAWNDPVTSETVVSVEDAEVTLLYLHTAVISDLLADWGMVQTPKQASPWLDEAVAKDLASERFFVQAQKSYSFLLQACRGDPPSLPLSRAVLVGVGVYGSHVVVGCVQVCIHSPCFRVGLRTNLLSGCSWGMVPRLFSNVWRLGVSLVQEPGGDGPHSSSRAHNSPLPPLRALVCRTASCASPAMSSTWWTTTATRARTPTSPSRCPSSRLHCTRRRWSTVPCPLRLCLRCEPCNTWQSGREGDARGGGGWNGVGWRGVPTGV